MRKERLECLLKIFAPLLCILFGFVLINGLILIGNMAEDKKIEKSAADFPVATDCIQGEGGEFVYNGMKYVRADASVFADWIPKPTDSSKGIKTDTLVAYALEDDVNSYIFEVQITFFDNYYCCSENIVFPDETKLPDRIIIMSGKTEFSEEDKEVVEIFMNNSEKARDIIKQNFPTAAEENNISVFACWDDFPLMRQIEI